MSQKKQISKFAKTALMLLMPLTLCAQQPNLENLLRQHPKKDTTRVNLLIELAEMNMYSDFEKVAEHGRAIKTLSDSLGYKRGQVAAIRLIAFQYIPTSDYETALAMAYQALEQSETLDIPRETVKNLWVIGFWHGKRGNYYRSLESFHRGLKLSEKNGFDKSTIKLLSSIGLVNYYQEEYDKALHYSRKSLDIARKTGDKIRECWILANISASYSEQQKYTEALTAVGEALSLSRNLGQERLTVQSLIYSGNIKIETGDYQNSMADYQEGVALGERINDKWYVCEGYLGLARTKYKMGDHDAARKFAKKGLDMAKAQGFGQTKANLHHVLSDIALAVEEHKTAYAHFRKYKQLSDSLVNEKNIKKVANLEQKYAFEIEKKHLNAEQDRNEGLQRAEIVRQSHLRKTTGIIALILFALTMAIFYGLLQKNRTNRLLMAQKSDIEAQNLALVELDRFNRAFMGSMVHNLKIPLDTIINQGGRSPEKALARAKGAGKQMLDMVLNILDVHKYKDTVLEPKKSPQQLLPIAMAAIDGVGTLAVEKNLRIVNHITEKTFVYCERELIQRVLANLLTNALDRSDGGGTVTIGTTITEEGMVAISVSDDAGEIAPEHLPHVFGGLEGSGDPNSGANLGLAFCKLAIGAHGGSIRVENKKGHGTIFTFTLEPAKDCKDAMEGFAYNLAGVLGDADMKILRPYLEALSNISVYEVGRFREVISKLPIDIGPIAQWKEGVEESVRQLDGERYTKLIQIDKRK